MTKKASSLRNKKINRWLAYLVFGLFLIIAVRVFVSDRFIDISDEIGVLEERRDQLLEANYEMSNELAKLGSFARISQEASDKLGLVYRPGAIDHLAPPVIASR